MNRSVSIYLSDESDACVDRIKEFFGMPMISRSEIINWALSKASEWCTDMKREEDLNLRAPEGGDYYAKN